MDYKRVVDILDKFELDAIITSDGYNMRYVSGFSGATGFMYVSKQQKVIITDSRYTIQARDQAYGFEVFEISIQKKYKDWLTEILKNEKVKRIGFDNASISYSEYILLQSIDETYELVKLDSALSDLRIIKTSEEIENIAVAESIGDKAFAQILDYIKPGMTELEVAARLEYIMKCEGAYKLSFDTIVASGINSSKPHAEPGHRIIQKGDFITMDFGCVYKGYCSDMTRTIVIGKANDKQKSVYYTVLEAQLRAMDVIKPGVKCADVDAVARKYIDEAGYKGCFGHGLGHSLGLFIHESPAFSPSCNARLETNMLETVEPGIYIEGFGGVRIEDLIVVTDDGFRNLTSSPKELIEL